MTVSLLLRSECSPYENLAVISVRCVSFLKKCAYSPLQHSPARVYQQIGRPYITYRHGSAFGDLNASYCKLLHILIDNVKKYFWGLSRIWIVESTESTNKLTWAKLGVEQLLEFSHYCLPNTTFMMGRVIPVHIEADAAIKRKTLSFHDE